MSLISDALKKARQDVARQDALRQRTPYAVGTADSADRRASFLPLLAGLGAGCVIAGLLLAAAWSAGWGPFGTPAKEAVKVAEAAPPVTRAAEPSAALPTVIPEPASPAQPQAAPPASSPAAPVQQDRPQPVIEVRPTAPEAPPAHPTPAMPAPVHEEPPLPVAVPSTPAPPAPAPSPPTAQAAGDLVDGQTYAGEVPVPGGGTVKLNGIVYSQNQPVAVLDGRVMAPGENIQGFTVVAIEAGRVKLQGFGAIVFVSPK